jgi:transposase
MSFIFEQTVGGHRYVFECESYRDENGQPRNRRTSIGKIDPATNRRVYKQDYLDKMKAAGTPIDIPDGCRQFSVEDIRRSSLREYGAFYLFQALAERIGLLPALTSALPDSWREVFMLACHLVATGDPFMHCDEWIKGSEALPVGKMSSQRISDLTASITPDMRDEFFRCWCARRTEDEYLALDITSTSSYSELIEDVEWGYNRDGEELPQVNICMLLGEKSRLPVYEVVYAGSLKDVTTLKTTLALFDGITGGKPVLSVMDKGFYSKRNVDALMSGKRQDKFIVAVPFTSKFAKTQVESERKDIDCIQNTVVVCGESMRAVSKTRAWGNGQRVFAHVYYAPGKALRKREDLYAHVALLRDEATASPCKFTDSTEHKKYLSIRKSGTAQGGYTVTVREDALNKLLQTVGWLVIISNDMSDAKEVLRIYRAKDVVEKGFLRLKCDLDLGRLRVHGQDRMQNKVFIGFISLILLSAIHATMSDKNLYAKMTMRQLIRRLAKLRVQEIGDQRIVYPATKTQRQIFEAFDIDPPL